MEGESLQDEVDAAAKDNCQDAIDPEEDEHGVEEPCAGLADRRTVLCDVDQNRPDTDQPCWDEEAFCWMRNRCREC